MIKRLPPRRESYKLRMSSKEKSSWSTYAVSKGLSLAQMIRAAVVKLMSEVQS